MIVTIIQFELDKSIDADRARAMFADSIEKFVGMPGLDRKYYLLSEDAATSDGMSTRSNLWCESFLGDDPVTVKKIKLKPA